jgi:hypothetical protein
MIFLMKPSKYKELSREAIEGLDEVMKERNDPMFGVP